MSGKKGTEIVPGSYEGVYAFPSPSELSKAVQQRLVSAMAGPAQQTAARPSTRRDWLMIAILVIALLGTLEASYLTFVHYYGLKALVCAGAHNGVSSCEQVQ